MLDRIYTRSEKEAIWKQKGLLRVPKSDRRAYESGPASYQIAFRHAPSESRKNAGPSQVSRNSLNLK